MFCPECGKKLEDDSKFCEHCGSRIESDTNEVTPIKEDESVPSSETNQKEPRKSGNKVWYVLISIFSVIVLFISLLIYIYTKPQSEWVEYGKGIRTHNDYSYKKGNVDKNGGNYIVQVWVKTDFSDSGREEMISQNRNGEVSLEGWDKLSREISLYDMDCQKNRTKILSYTLYDTNGKVLNSWKYDNPTWEDTISHQDLEGTRQRVCK